MRRTLLQGRYIARSFHGEEKEGKDQKRSLFGKSMKQNCQEAKSFFQSEK